MNNIQVVANTPISKLRDLYPGEYFFLEGPKMKDRTLCLKVSIYGGLAGYVNFKDGLFYQESGNPDITVFPSDVLEFYIKRVSEDIKESINGLVHGTFFTHSKDKNSALCLKVRINHCNEWTRRIFGYIDLSTRTFCEEVGDLSAEVYRCIVSKVITESYSRPKIQC